MEHSDSDSDYASPGDISDSSSDSDHSVQFLDELTENDYQELNSEAALPHSYNELMSDWQLEMSCGICNIPPTADQAFAMLPSWVEKESLRVLNLAAENAGEDDAFMYCSTCDSLFHFTCVWENFAEHQIIISDEWKCYKCD